MLYVNLSSLFAPGKHVLSAGGSGSGKTSLLLLLAGRYFERGEIILWRDDSSLEFLSLADEIPLQIFIPKNCTLDFTHPNITYFPYDPRHILTIFNNIDHNKLNAVLYDLFCFKMEHFIKFWERFFYNLYKWKRTRINLKVTFVTDELNDLAPGVKRGFIPKQLSLASKIYFCMKKFRKEKIRLVASTHSLTDLHKPVRDSFNFYFIRQMRRESVPPRFWDYSHTIERLGINQAIVVDEIGAFNRIKIPLYVKPKNFSVNFDGDIEEFLDGRGQKRQAMWRARTKKLGKFMLDNKFVEHCKELADIIGVDQSTAWRLINED